MLLLGFGAFVEFLDKQHEYYEKETMKSSSSGSSLKQADLCHRSLLSPPISSNSFAVSGGAPTWKQERYMEISKKEEKTEESRLCFKYIYSNE